MTIAEGGSGFRRAKSTRPRRCPLMCFSLPGAAPAGPRDRRRALGTGGDGTLGVEAIKGEGGITFAQDERSSKYLACPAAPLPRTRLISSWLRPRFARELGRIARHPYIDRRARARQAACRNPRGGAGAGKPHLLDAALSLLRPGPGGFAFTSSQRSNGASPAG